MCGTLADITVEDDVLFGKHGGALASETLEAEACAGTCGNPICESTDGELQRCGKCRR